MNSIINSFASTLTENLCSARIWVMSTETGTIALCELSSPQTRINAKIYTAKPIVVYPSSLKLIYEITIAAKKETIRFTAILSVSLLVFCMLRTVISPAVMLYFKPISVEITIAAAHPSDIFAALKTELLLIFSIYITPCPRYFLSLPDFLVGLIIISGTARFS